MQTWHASCKELRSFLNHVSSKAQYSSVIFLEADFEKDSMRVRRARALCYECILFPPTSQTIDCAHTVMLDKALLDVRCHDQSCASAASDRLY